MQNDFKGYHELLVAYSPLEWVKIVEGPLWSLYANPMAIPYFDNDKYIQLKYLRHACSNTNAIPLIKRYITHFSDNDWYEIIKNSNAIEIIEDKLNNMDQNSAIFLDYLEELVHNKSPEVIPIIKNHLDKISDKAMSFLFANPNALDIIQDNLDKLKIHYLFNHNLCANPKAMHLINHNFIDWCGIARNTNLEAIKLIEDNFSKITEHLNNYELRIYNIYSLYIRDFWKCLCTNPNAIHILEKNTHRFGYEEWININANPNGVSILEKHPDKINWEVLSLNPNAIPILEKNKDKIYWYKLLQNPSIFKINYKRLTESMRSTIAEELMAVTWHPNRFKDWCLDNEERKFFSLKN